MSAYPATPREEHLSVLRANLAPDNTGLWCPRGWVALSVATHRALQRVDPNYKIVGIKEKFGRLVFSADSYTPQARAIITYAENLSCHICQNCGAPDAGSVTAGWIATLCDGCTVYPSEPRRGY